MQGQCEGCGQSGFVYKTTHLCEDCQHDIMEE